MRAISWLDARKVFGANRTREIGLWCKVGGTKMRLLNCWWARISKRECMRV